MRPSSRAVLSSSSFCSEASAHSRARSWSRM
ncbi:Uncharacterised protein [Bordetella pertussis]|nr:Uncharacterised protein [Bordetella pertussis]